MTVVEPVNVCENGLFIMGILVYIFEWASHKFFVDYA
jgi:hypothetical protein